MSEAGGEVTPTQVFEDAKKVMLHGADPVTGEDWDRLVNFWACSFDVDHALDATMEMVEFTGCPTPVWMVDQIVKFHTEYRRSRLN
jgi:hypothetical protein